MNNMLEIKNVDINTLVPCEYNPRTITDAKMDQLKESILKFNIVQPILVNSHTGRENIIIGGNQRVKIMKELGYTTIPVIFLDLNLEDEKNLNLRLNISNGEWNLKMLQEDFSIDLLLDVGFGEEELGKMFDDVISLDDIIEKDEEENSESEYIQNGNDNENKEQNTEETKDIKDTEIKEGDIFAIGPHKIICGDSTNPETISSLLGDKKVDVFLTDFPYNINLSYDKGLGGKASYGGKTDDNKTDEEYEIFITKILENSMKFFKEDTHVFSFCDQNYIWLFQSIYRKHGIKLQRVCEWIKTNGFNPTPLNAFNKLTESCVYGTLGKPYIDNRYRNFTEILDKEVSSGNRISDDILDMLDIWLVKRISGMLYEHPTQKPVSLYEKPLRRCSKINDIILDTTFGSGSLCLACHGLKRIFYGVEIEPAFCQLLINRMEKVTGVKAIKLN